MLDATLSRIDNEIDQSLNRLFDFLKIKKSKIKQNKKNITANKNTIKLEWLSNNLLPVK